MNHLPEPPPPKAQEPFTVDDFRPEDAGGIVRLVRAVYGEHYPIRLFYDPAEIIRANREGQYYSIVARTPAGEVIGVNHLYPSAPCRSLYESGVGLVLKEYRSLGVSKATLGYIYEEFAPRHSHIEEVFGEAVCNHPYMQKSIAPFRFIETAIEVALMPAEAYAKEKSAVGRVATLTAFLALSDEGLMAQAAQAAADAQALEAPEILAVTHSGGAPFSRAVDLLRAVCDHAAARGVSIAIETHPDLCENGDQAAALLAAVDHPAFGWNLDTGNIYYYNHGTDPVTEVRKAAAHVRSLHAKDSDGGFASPHFPNLGEGVVDFAGVGAVLREVGFTGPYTMELEGLAGAADSVERMEANVAQCAGHLRSLGLVD